MARCLNCRDEFSVTQVRSEWDEWGEEYGEGDYSDELCSGCLMPGLESVANQGRAILMMSGDEDYDDDFVQEWL